MRSSEHNRGNISSLIGGKMLNFGVEAFLILVFLNITTKLVISLVMLVTALSSPLLVIQPIKPKCQQLYIVLWQPEHSSSLHFMLAII